ncbi:kinetochore-associated Ndc80 complex subunit ndc80 [Entophlyctis sp. JEL0112]|nr:kinetochore-associated Ndc80 complex subunit ndc80 [Entophlyctis sp. JEL0112]
MPNASRLSMAPPRPPGASSSSALALADTLANLQLGNARASVASRATMAVGGLAGQPGGRRSSTLLGRPSNIGALLGAQPVVTKDPRPIRDKQWQANAIRGLISFLVQAGFNQIPVSPKTLQAPSAKDFAAIFKFLYAQLDPHHLFVKKFEEEVPAILKGLKYPFCDQISKSHLQSVGSMHAWPSLLAMLSWMVELILCCDQMDSQIEIEEDPSAQGEKVFFDYLTKAYSTFLAGDDDYDNMDNELIANFDRKNEKIVKDIEKLKSEYDVLSKEFASLRDSESPLAIAERESATLASDIEKFKQYISHLELKKQKLEDQVKVVEEELGIQESELEKQTIEKVELAAIVDSQEISPADVDRMTSEREQLVRTLEGLAKKTEDTNKLFWEKEMAVQKKMDQLEKLVHSFNTMAYDLGFLTPGSEDAEGVNFELEVFFTASKLDEMVSVDLHNKIKPLLLKVRSKYNASAHAFEDEAIAAQEYLDRLTESVSDKCDALMALEGQIAKMNERYNEEKEALSKASLASSKEMEVLEHEMQKMKTDSANALIQSQQKLQKSTLEHDQLCHRFQEAKDRVEKAVLRVLEGMIGMKEHVTTLFMELREAVDADLRDAPYSTIRALHSSLPNSKDKKPSISQSPVALVRTDSSRALDAPANPDALSAIPAGKSSRFVAIGEDVVENEEVSSDSSASGSKSSAADPMISMLLLSGPKAMTIRGVVRVALERCRIDVNCRKSFDTKGAVTELDQEFPRVQICVENSLQPRDLRKLDSSLSDQSQAILVRRKAILVNLAHIRALVRGESICISIVIFNTSAVHSADKVLILSPPTENVEIAQHQSGFIYELQGALSNQRDSTAFELKVMESILNSASTYLLVELEKHERQAEVLLKSIDVDISGSKLNSLLLLRRSYNKFLQRVEGFRSAITAVLTNDEDLADMYVTDKALGKPHAVSDHIDMELMLEHYAKVGDDLVSRILETSSNLQTTQNMIGIILDNKRNRLIVYDLQANLATAAISSAALLAALLGMNLPNHIDNIPYIFEIVTAVSFVTVTGVYFGAVRRMGAITKWKGIISRHRDG